MLGLVFDYIFHSSSKAETNKMSNIAEFLSEFENLIFDGHLEMIQSFQRRHGEAVSCSCSHIIEEKENILKIMDKYINLSERFNVQWPLTLDRSVSSLDLSRDEKILRGSYDIVG